MCYCGRLFLFSFSLTQREIFGKICMDEQKIAWDMYYGLPDQTYLEFIARYILQQRDDQPLVDPFALDVPADMNEDIYVERETVENEVVRSGTLIVLGPEGSGKTSLFRRLPRLLTLRNRALIVQLSLDQIGASVPEQELMEGKISLLTAELLARYIFDAYWEDLIHAYDKRAQFLSQLRSNQWWMRMLRWFYHRYRPLYPEIPEEFELLVWLNTPLLSEPFNPNAPEDTLRELVRFVTFQQEQYGASPSQPYARVQVLIDGTERPSNPAIIRLIQDAQKLYDLHLGIVQFKLFADSAWQGQVKTMDCVRQGRVPAYNLPQWREDELHQILHHRLTAWGRRGEYTEYNWGNFIPARCLKPAARTGFVKTIVGGATRVYSEKENDLDAPIHVLRLARVLVAACAGCWGKYGCELPLNHDQIKALVNIYWKMKEEGSNVSVQES